MAISVIKSDFHTLFLAPFTNNLSGGGRATFVIKLGIMAAAAAVGDFWNVTGTGSDLQKVAA